MKAIYKFNFDLSLTYEVEEVEDIKDLEDLKDPEELAQDLMEMISDEMGGIDPENRVIYKINKAQRHIERKGENNATETESLY